MRVGPRRQGLFADLASGEEVVLTRLTEVTSLAQEIGRALGLATPEAEAQRLNAMREAPPKGFVVENAIGRVVLEEWPEQRRKHARICFVVAAVLLAAATFLVVREAQAGALTPGTKAAAGVLGVVAAPFLLLALLAQFGRVTLAVGERRLVRTRYLFGWQFVRRCESPTLLLERSVDSDGDDHYTLTAKGGAAQPDIRLGSDMNDSRRLIHLGQFVAGRAGVAFHTPRE